MPTMVSTPKRFFVILDIGHGNCSILRDDDGTIVIDTGLGTALFEFLTQEGIDRVDVVLLSHADEDHISGLVHLLACRKFSIGRVRLNTDGAKKTALWENLIYELERQDAAAKVDWEVALTANSKEDYSQGRVAVSVLAPGKALAARGPGGTSKGRRITTNSISAVIRLSQGSDPIAVLPGDMDEIGLVLCHTLIFGSHWRLVR